MSMKFPSTDLPQKLRNHDNTTNKGERCLNVRKLTLLLLTFLSTITVSTLFILSSTINKPVIITKQNHDQNFHANQTKPSLIPNHLHKKEKDKEKECDVSRGLWVQETRNVSLYSNSSCLTIPDSKNCFAHGRSDVGFLNWKWKPDTCHLPSFDAKAFLDLVRGKKMGFVGDSVARNHFESLLCLLSPEETPRDIHKDGPEDRFRIWHFPRHNFTLTMLWTKFLVKSNERKVNESGTGVFDLYLDRIDRAWSKALPELDYLVLSAGHWFFRPMYLNKGKNLMGCVYCPEPGLTKHDVGFAVRMAFRAALEFVGRESGLVTVVRTFAPAHFEGGSWNTGGHCNRTGPIGEARTEDSFDWEMRKVQVEEVERARKRVKKMGSRFGVLDVTRAMIMRPDGHPGTHWPNEWMKGFSDCVHWCMPGPVDYWSALLMEVMRRETGLV